MRSLCNCEFGGSGTEKLNPKSLIFILVADSVTKCSSFREKPFNLQPPDRDTGVLTHDQIDYK